MNWFSPLSSSRELYRITIGSDWAPIWSYEKLMKENASAVYGDLLPVFQQSDLNIVNVECIIGDAGAPIPKAGPCLKGETDIAIPALKAVPFHVATLANNHSMDYGPESLDFTIRKLREEGLATVGAGMDAAQAAQPLIISRKGGDAPIAIVNFGEGEACASLDGGPGVNVYDVEIQEAQIRELKKAGHVVVAIFHGGREHAVMPPPYVVRGLRRLADAGADAVLAHHPHVPQGVEIHHGVPIAYSLGNFVFRREDPGYYQTLGYLVHLDVDKNKVISAALTPYKMTESGVFSLQGEEKDGFLEDLKTLSNYLASPEAIETLWNAFADDSLLMDSAGVFQTGEKAVLEKLKYSLELYKSKPAVAISYFHHYFFAPAHREYFSDAFKRLKLGTFGNSPEWALELVRRWKQ